MHHQGRVSVEGKLSRLGVDGILFNNSEGMPSINVRYLSGFSGSDGTVLITKSERSLFTDGRYKTQAGIEAPGFQVHIVKTKLDALARTLKEIRVKRLGIEASRLSFEFVARLQAKVPELAIVSLPAKFLESLRIRKTKAEREAIETAAGIASSACRTLLDKGLVGRKESDVAGDLEHLFRQGGAEGIAFETIVAAGERSALPHGKASDRVIRKGELVVLDFGCRWNGYHSDETVACITGKPTAEQKRLHTVVYDAHNAALEITRAGVRARAVDAAARSVIEHAGLGKFFLHGLGHGVGMEIHEPPRLSTRATGTLQEGMVFTIEPGVYVEGLGGVRLESLVYLGSQGPEILSTMTKELIRVG
jgi:Xaa-Pro aminopeptidase